MTNGVTNDLGFQVRDKLILLVEAQSKFSVNIALRMLLYLAATYKEYVDDHKLDLYGGKPVPIPRPELYMIYAGAPRQLPEILRLSDMYDGPGSAEIEIKVLREHFDAVPGITAEGGAGHYGDLIRSGARGGDP